jgi:hypothetical protein
MKIPGPERGRIVSRLSGYSFRRFFDPDHPENATRAIPVDKSPSRRLYCKARTAVLNDLSCRQKGNLFAFFVLVHLDERVIMLPNPTA